MRAFLVAILLLTACTESSSPSALETPFQVRVTVICGVEWTVIEYEGAKYRMRALNRSETESPPRGWQEPAIITIIEEDGRLLAIGPDGSERELVRTHPDATTEPCL